VIGWTSPAKGLMEKSACSEDELANRASIPTARSSELASSTSMRTNTDREAISATCRRKETQVGLDIRFSDE
jgi:hypothetical protein